MLSSANCAILAAENVSRCAGHFPSSAAVEGKRHFKFSPLRVAAGFRLCTHEKGCPGLSLHVSIPCPHIYGLVRSRSSLLLKGAIEEVSSSDLNRGFFSRYFLVPKKDGGFRPILYLCGLNYSLYRGKFRMLTLKSILSQFPGTPVFS